MQSNQTRASEAQKRIMETMQEFFPVLEKLKDILVRLQATKLYFYVYSPSLPALEQEYLDVSAELFKVDRKLTTPNILFEGLPEQPNIMIDYFQFEPALRQSLSDATKYTEIIDRTLDRKRQTVQNNWTLVIAVVAIIVSIIWR